MANQLSSGRFRAGSAEVNPWFVAVVVSLAAFMEVLDTSIANVALPHIAGDMGARTDESTWVLTSYLVSNAIILPVSGWFVGMVSLVVYEWRHREPIVDVRLFRNGNFAAANMMMFMVGAISLATGLSRGFESAISSSARQLVEGGISPPDARRHALARFYAGLEAQAASLAYMDTYFVLAVAAGLMILLAFTLRRNNPRAAAKVPLH